MNKYIKELESQLCDMISAKTNHMRAYEWEKAAACRDIEQFIQTKIRDYKETEKRVRKEITKTEP